MFYTFNYRSARPFTFFRFGLEAIRHTITKECIKCFFANYIWLRLLVFHATDLEKYFAIRTVGIFDYLELEILKNECGSARTE